MYCTEAEVMEMLLDLAKETDEAPHVFVAFREAFSGKSLKRTVTFVIQTKTDNEALVNKIVKASSESEMVFKFMKSDMNIQDGNFEVDYLFVEADISPKLI